MLAVLSREWVRGVSGGLFLPSFPLCLFGCSLQQGLTAGRTCHSIPIAGCAAASSCSPPARPAAGRFVGALGLGSWGGAVARVGGSSSVRVVGGCLGWELPHWQRARLWVRMGVLEGDCWGVS